MSRTRMSPEQLYDRGRLLARLEAKRTVTASGCWEWTGYLIDGYGKIYIGEKDGRLVHRLAYELLIGPIPDGLQIDHLCRNRKCHNPEHLEPVTPRVNVLRGELPSAVAHMADLCQQGLHDLAGAYVNPRGQRQCRQCRNAKLREKARR